MPLEVEPVTPPAATPAGNAGVGPGRVGESGEHGRAELLSREQLVDLARRLAVDHASAARHRRARPLLRRVDADARALYRAYRETAGAARRRQPITPAAEWLLDNFHVVEEQIEDVREHLPRRYYGELPKIPRGEHAGYPRIYVLAQALVAHTDGALDESLLLDAVRAYQDVAPLGIGELWAIPIMLRVSLLDNLCRLTRPLESDRRAREAADEWADNLLRVSAERPGDVTVLLGELARRRERLHGPYVVRLFQRLRGRGAAVAPVLEWIETYLRERGLGIEDLVRRENQSQAAGQVSVSNTITSFRLLDRIDWEAFFERTSLVHALLCEDPAGAYARSDFRTRDSCRRVVEQAARRSGRSEAEAARAAVELAAAAAPPAEGEGQRRRHVGYYLIDEGVRAYEARLGARPALRERVRRAILRRPAGFYLGGLALAAAALLLLAAAWTGAAGAPAPLLAAAVLIALPAAFELAVCLVNTAVTRWLPPRVLPKLDFRSGIPPDCRTLVVVPTLLGSEQGVDELLERLEIHYLANQDPQLHFALLTDYLDSSAEEEPGDQALLHRAVEGILQLNARYEGATSFNRFFLFHRRRLWNPAQGCWMGWERKRGKLVELNRLLRGAKDTTFVNVIGDRTALQDIRYVLCLDSDTRLPPDAARRLVGALAHPLNVAEVDPRLGRVTRGYGILQPRVSPTLTSAGKSLFARLFCAGAGVDPYTTAVSDLYQDLFGEGIFCGKGLYDLDAFDRVLEDRVPENSLLSHDLFEGCFARCGLASDVELFDDCPSRYNSYSARQHRWIRGDWQLLPWLLPRVRNGGGGTVPNPLSLMARWKIADNLRRSLVAPALLILLASAWLWMPGVPWTWTLLALLVLFSPGLTAAAASLLDGPGKAPPGLWLAAIFDEALVNAGQAGFRAAVLAHQAWSSLDAAIRTLWRLCVSRRRMLEWQTAAETERRLGAGPAAFLRRMWSAPVLVCALAPAIAAARPEALAPAAPLLLVWFLSPAAAWWLSLPLRPPPQPLTDRDRLFLRRIARKTWRFFQETVTARDHWLPPDNFQEDRPDVLAHRTSPTNLGLLLLSTVSARDMGYLGLLEAVDRLERTLWTMAGMERFRGHFYNWYETLGPTPIQPFYISSVDSGNLAGHLLAVKQACLEMLHGPLFSADILGGLADTVALLRAEAERSGTSLRVECDALERLLSHSPRSGLEWHARLEQLAAAAARLGEKTAAGTPSGGTGAEPPADEVMAWCRCLQSQVRALQRDLDTLLPWIRPLSVQPPPFGDGRPLGGDVAGRPHAFADLVTPPRGRPRGLAELPDAMSRALAEADRLEQGLDAEPMSERGRATARAWLADVRRVLEACLEQRVIVIQRLTGLAGLCQRLFEEMDFSFLYDRERDLFAVGYNVPEARLDSYHYDLLASECRLASLIAIAKGDVPQKHWFRMGRPLAAGRRERALISWGGTMFEYMMPLLVMRAYDDTLLAQSLPAVVHRQQRFAAREGVPWGFSESGYAARDRGMSYQYRTFGVPGLGLKPDVFEDLVVTPYATLLALPVAPRAAARNLEWLAREGLECRYGFYEAIDYTPSRMPRGSRSEVVRSLMAHHQGMALVSLANALDGGRMQARFHADPLVKSVELLLQERVPRVPAAHPRTQQVRLARTVQAEAAPSACRHFTTADTAKPRVQLLSNGRYSVMVTNAGGGYSAWNGLAVTRWREDGTRDHWGQFVYLRDVATGEVWSIAWQPLPGEGSYEVYFTEDKAEFQRRAHGIVAHLEIAVSAEDCAEVRRVTLANSSAGPREIEVTSYAEIVLAPHAADQAHPAFSKLFVETEFLAARNALLATRRPRSPQEARPWAVHVLAHEGLPAEIWSPAEFETDRAAFLGRGRTPAEPIALALAAPLSRSTGPVLDPVVSLRQRVRIAPGQTVRLAFTTGAAATREEVVALAERYHDLRAVSRVFDLAWTHSQVELRHLGVSGEQAMLCQELASRLQYSDAFVRAPEAVLSRNTQGQTGLWAYGISGDLPIVLVHARSFDHLRLVRELLSAQQYLRHLGLRFDLVILNEHPPGYLQPFEEALQDAARSEGAHLDQPGGVFIRRLDLIPDAGRILLQFVARAVFSGLHGSLSDQLAWRPERPEPPRELRPRRPAPQPGALPAPRARLSFFNGLGGFTADGREYRVYLPPGAWTPAPWANVIANPRFGCLVTESGVGFTWSENSRENRLTPWSNDPVADPQGEAVYIRDEDTGRYWSAAPLPARGEEAYVVRHAAGSSRWEHSAQGLEHELLVFVPPRDSVKIFRLRVKNASGRARSLSAAFYAEWVLGAFREQSAPHVSTSVDAATGALLARNSYNAAFAGRVAFAAVDERIHTWTCDRAEFIGRGGSLAHPRALSREDLSGASGVALDPCAALHVRFSLQPGASRELLFTLGEASGADEARALAARYQDAATVRGALVEVETLWEELLGAVQVRTPDPSLDLLLNRWLLYQVLACRIWARSAFYQSGGAYGFRDQLQDVMALIASGGAPGWAAAREQILLHAARQFVEGDVQHWWHPPSGRGIRTRFSDDLLWLPYVAAQYVRVTADDGILDEVVPFLEGRPLEEGEDEYYDLPIASDESASLYEHCLRAIRRGCTRGPRGLPLMGTGDWNDGMNRVGREGRGESVWVAWFLISVLGQFAPLCERRGDAAAAAEFRAAAEGYRRAVEEEAWDGDWYRRAYFDDGTPLGTAGADECRIDSLAQTWAVISGAGDPDRALRAMDAVERHLVREEEGLILLFTPPFDRGTLEPGYIKGYVPGVRENGGQYTHAALWTVLATAMLGRGRRAYELFTLLNPIRHAGTPEGCARYRVEPYGVAADVYGVPPHTGRGGWSWYTGSASWMYRVGLEGLLGFRLEGDTLLLDPCIPPGWPGFEIDYRRGQALYRIRVENPDGVERGVREVTLDGARLPGARVPLDARGGEHHVRVLMGRVPA